MGLSAGVGVARSTCGGASGPAGSDARQRGPLGRLLPDDVIVVELPSTTVPDALMPPEQVLVRGASAERRLEFALGRTCARRALAGLGLPAAPPILRDARGAPQWPAGAVGSISHGGGVVCAAAARSRAYAALGVDVEADQPLGEGVLALVAGEAEVRGLEGRGAGHAWDTLIFSIKECVYKLWHPLRGTWLGFHDVEVMLHPEAGVFEARVVAPGLGPFSARGRFAFEAGLIRTAAAAPVAS